MSQQSALATVKATTLLSYTGQSLPRRWSFPSAQHQWSHTCTFGASSGFLCTREIQAYWECLVKEHQDDPGTGAPFLGGGSRRAQTLQSGENLWVDFTNVNKYLKGGRKEDKARIFQTVPTARMRSNRHKLEHRQFPLTMRKHFSAVRAQEHWHRLWSPLQEIFRSQKKKKKSQTHLTQWLMSSKSRLLLPDALLMLPDSLKPCFSTAYSKSYWRLLISCRNLFAFAVIKYSFTDKTLYPTITGL